MIHIDKASVVSGRGGRAGAGRAEKKTDAQPRVSKSGISDADAVRMREMYGSNALTKKKSRSLLSHFISNFNDPIIKILLGALALNVIFSFRHSNWPETIGVAIQLYRNTARRRRQRDFRIRNPKPVLCGAVRKYVNYTLMK